MGRSYWYPAAVGTRLSIVAGVLSGGLVAVLILAGVLAFAPERSPVADASPSPTASRAPGSPGPGDSTDPAGSALTSASPAPDGTLITTNFHVGEPAPPISVPQLGGGHIDLAALRGKPVWINLMATWCPSCREEFPTMSGFAVRYASSGLVIVAIDVREDEGTVASFVNEVGATFPIGLDEDGAVATAWDAIALPMHFWVDAEGIVRYGAVGGIGPDEMVRGLRTILPGVEVTP